MQPSLHRAATVPIGLLSVVLYAAVLPAQRDDDDGERRRRGGFDFASRLREMDANGDGRLSDDEMSERARGFIYRIAERADLDRSRPLSIDELARSISSRWTRRDDDDDDDDDRDDDRRDRDRRSSGSDADKVPLVPGFGVDLQLPAVPGFGDVVDGGVRGQGVPLEDRYGDEVVRFADRILDRYDRDDSGVLERDEWSRGRWRTPPETSDLNKDGKLTREELCERVKDYDGLRGSSSRNSNGSSRGSRANDDDRDRYRRYAESLLRRYDENDSGVLEENEFRRMSSYHRGADANGDNVITQGELADRLASYGRDGGSSERRRSSGIREAAAGESYIVTGERLEGGRKTYRARTPTERLPQGLPDWFLRNDANGDGQIFMAEYAVSWTDEKLREFQNLDANGDGLITPEEYMSAETAKQDNSHSPQSSFNRPRDDRRDDDERDRSGYGKFRGR